MKLAILSCRSAPLGIVLFCCIILGLLTVLPAASQSDNLTRITMPMSEKMNNYAELAYILPSRVNVEADTLQVYNYTGGRDVKASILLNGSRVSLYLLYPCQPPQALLETGALKTLLAASDPAILKANYSDTLLAISGRPAIWGQMANQIFAAYQPTNQTAAVVVMDGGLPEETMADFLGNLSITPNEGVTPLWPGYCPDTTVTTAASTVAPVSAETTAAPANETAVANPAPSTPAAATPTVAEIVKGKTMSRNEKMAADRAAALAKLDEERQKMKGY
jgi:hypothetical protein